MSRRGRAGAQPPPPPQPDADVAIVARPLALGGGARPAARRGREEPVPEFRLSQNMQDLASASGMTNSHRMLIQAFLSRRFMPQADAHEALRAVLKAYDHPDAAVPAHNVEAALNDMLTTVNKNLRLLQLEIKKVSSESPDGTVYYGLINTKGDAFAQLATTLSLEEISLFKKILDAIIASPDDRELMPKGELNRTEAENLGLELEKKLIASQARIAIDKLGAAGWLDVKPQRGNEEGTVSAGIRTLLELRPWMEEFYHGHIPECVFCADPVLKGQSCPNMRCTTRSHVHCLVRWFRDKRDRKCPTCTQEWHQD
eukprot:TRINITY_DN5176_c0_g1_i2.p1 TRINITY_DN5176_c0_g1~~TRINITY_DN5176_c0_g1_i2.p1  ORF type:complete len:314 (-),score=96.00 TRINITY_DN5176_c0_g1_i2:79-1020(-)